MFSEFNLTEGFSYRANNQVDDFCNLLTKSLGGDSLSIINFTKLEFQNGFFAEQGSLLIDIIDNIGTERFVEIIENLDSIEKYYIKSCIDHGLQYNSNPKYYLIRMNKSLPYIYENL